MKICPMRFMNSSPTKVSKAISLHHTSHGKMVWVKQASSRCSYWQELKWQSLAWLDLCRQPWKELPKFSPSNIVLVPYAQLNGMKKDVSKFRPLGCKVYVHLNKERREKGKHTPRAVEAIHLGFASDCNMSAYKFYISSSRKCIVSNQALFDEESFSYRNQDMIKGSWTKIIISKFYLWISCLQGGLISRQMLEMENTTF